MNKIAKFLYSHNIEDMYNEERIIFQTASEEFKDFNEIFSLHTFTEQKSKIKVFIEKYKYLDISGNKTLIKFYNLYNKDEKTDQKEKEGVLIELSKKEKSLRYIIEQRFLKMKHLHDIASQYGSQTQERIDDLWKKDSELMKGMQNILKKNFVVLMKS